MPNLLAPSYELTVGNQRWTEQLRSLDVELAFGPSIGRLNAVLPTRAASRAALGDDVRLVLDSGEVRETVFIGRLVRQERRLDALVWTAIDAAGELARVRPAVTFEQLTVASAIENICSDAGVDTASLETGEQLAFYVADPGRNALEHVTRLAAFAGALVRANRDGEIESRVLQPAQATRALRYGREITSIREADVEATLEQVVVAGESGVGSPDAPEALQPTVDFFAGQRPAGPDRTVRWEWQPALRTTAAAARAGASRSLVEATAGRGGALEAFLLPAFEPGTVFEIQDLPTTDSGAFASAPRWAQRVRHRFDARGARTRIEFGPGGSDFDPMAFLGALGSLGGLF